MLYYHSYWSNWIIRFFTVPIKNDDLPWLCLPECSILITKCGIAQSSDTPKSYVVYNIYMIFPFYPHFVSPLHQKCMTEYPP